MGAGPGGQSISKIDAPVDTFGAVVVPGATVQAMQLASLRRVRDRRSERPVAAGVHQRGSHRVRDGPSGVFLQGAGALAGIPAVRVAVGLEIRELKDSLRNTF